MYTLFWETANESRSLLKNISKQTLEKGLKSVSIYYQIFYIT